MKYRVFLILLHYKAYHSLEISLHRLQKMLLPKSVTLQIIVVDNETDKKNLDTIKKKFPKEIFLPQKENLGVPAGFNVGYRYAYTHDADFIMMLSPDLRMESDVIKKLYNVMIKNPKIGIASAKLLLNTKPPRIFFVNGALDSKRKSAKHVGFNEIDNGQYDYLNNTEFVNCPLLIRREIFERVGYFRPEFFMYYEDIDWQFRIRKMGYKLLCVKDAIAWNMEPDQIGKIYIKKEYYNARNLLYFVSLNFSPHEILLVYLLTIKTAIRLFINFIEKKDKEKSKYELLGIRDFFLGRMGKANYFSS